MRSVPLLRDVPSVSVYVICVKPKRSESIAIELKGSSVTDGDNSAVLGFTGVASGGAISGISELNLITIFAPAAGAVVNVITKSSMVKAVVGTSSINTVYAFDATSSKSIPVLNSV